MILSKRFHKFICILIVLIMSLGLLIPSFALDPSSENDKVVLQLRWDHQFQFAGYYAAIWMGYYEEEGIDIEIRSIFQNGKTLDAPTEVSEGRADFGVGAANLLIAEDSGHDLTLVASIFQQSAVEYCTLLSDRGNTVYDLSRLNIARRPGDLLDLELQALFASEGISPYAQRASDITRDFDLEDLTNGTYDVVPEFLSQISYIASKKNIPLKVIKPAEYGIDFYGDTLFTSRELAANDPELVERFRRASNKGWLYALENPDEIIDLIINKLERSKLSPDMENELKEFNTYQAEKVLELTHYPIMVIGNINKFRWRKMAEVMNQLEMISEVPDFDTMIFDYDQIKLNELEETKQDIQVYFVMITLIIVMFFMAYLNRRNILLSEEISVRQLVEKRLKLSNSRYETIFKSSVLGITVTDFDGRISTVNEAWCRMTGYSEEELCEMNINKLISVEYHDTDKKQLLALKEGKISSYTLVKKYLRRPTKEDDSDYFYGRMVLTRIWNEVSEPMLNMSMVTDVTREVQETEANLRSEMRFRKIVGQVAQQIGGAKLDELDLSSESSMNLEQINMELEKLFTQELKENRRKDALIRYQAKMATMGEMIGSIAHQWRQPLNTLKLVLMNLKDSSDDPEYEEICHNKANTLIKRMSETIDDFRYFSNPQTEPRYFSIEESINLVRGLVDEQLRVSGITLEVDCKMLPPLYGFDNQFSHVLFNLVSNAIDAIKLNPMGKPRLIRITGKNNNMDLILRVEDSGPGIPNENSEKIFDMYFTTKEEDGGSGLGLAMASSILENTFNGNLDLVDTEIGCTFELKIPYLERMV